MNKTIYVLIPAYNTGKYIAEALDSLIWQTDSDWVGLLCDDGSTDHTLSIMKEYAKKDKRFKVFHQENGGVGSALNRLLNHVPDEAEYIAFLDSDDIMHPQMLEILRNSLLKAKADVSECQICVMRNGLPEINSKRFKAADYETFMMVPKDCLLKRTAGLNGQSWINKVNKLYSWQKIKSLRFDEQMHLFEEDFLYNSQVHYSIRSKVIVRLPSFLPLPLYYRREHAGSVTGTVNWEIYQKAGARRIELSDKWFIKEKRLPAAMKEEFLTDLAADAFRMVVLKPLKRSRRSTVWASKRFQLFQSARQLTKRLFEIKVLNKKYFTPYQRLVLLCVDKGFYRLTLFLLLFK